MNSPSIKDLYLHIPYCTGKCAYCSFFSGPPPAHPANYITTLAEEYQAREEELAPLDTLYCGGGTPSLLGIDGFERLRALPFITFASSYEWTVEVHPATIQSAFIERLAALGVNRLSIGVQSLDDTVLRKANRRHTVKQALEGLALARQIIPDTGIDLIAGLPGVSPQQWEETLKRVIALDLPHLSIYGLSIEEGCQWFREGRQPPEDDTLCHALSLAHEHLTAAGFEHYEISNYAKPGFQCRHNLNTWLGGDYLGLGYGAHSRCQCHRQEGNGERFTLSPLEDSCERAFTQLRLRQPFDIPSLIQKYPLLSPAQKRLEQKVALFSAHALLDADLCPTPRGFEVVDAMIRECYRAIDD